ncbi:unnamed protein product [Gongylonema pulchrum]|uniref:Uncharacterized protein n=1 Tax=Gongylonema pulchrum TaxID=637853 RepID=A0A183EE65_9BILA|nr:unnamed protein product [Gongylonema pulchrum]
MAFDSDIEEGEIIGDEDDWASRSRAVERRAVAKRSSAHLEQYASQYGRSDLSGKFKDHRSGGARGDCVGGCGHGSEGFSVISRNSNGIRDEPCPGDCSGEDSCGCPEFPDVTYINGGLTAYRISGDFARNREGAITEMMETSVALSSAQIESTTGGVQLENVVEANPAPDNELILTDSNTEAIDNWIFESLGEEVEPKISCENLDNKNPKTESVSPVAVDNVEAVPHCVEENNVLVGNMYNLLVTAREQINSLMEKTKILEAK